MVLDGKSERLGRSSQNLTGESHKHWSLHVAELVWSSSNVFLFFTNLFSAVDTLVSSHMTRTWTARGGLLNVLCPFLKCCTVSSSYASQIPAHYGLHFLPSSHIFWHLKRVHENPAPSCSSSRSINSEVAICESPREAGPGSVCVDLGPCCTCRYFLFLEQDTQTNHFCLVKKTSNVFLFFFLWDFSFYRHR